MTHRRTVGEQVKSGLRIGGSMVLAIFFFAALVASTSYFLGRNGGEVSSISKAFGCLALVALTTILFLTTRHWTKWVVGFLGYCLLRFIGALLFGPYLKQPVSRFEVAGWMVYLLIAILLTARHAERPPQRTERLGLVGFVLGAPFAMTLSSYKPLLCALLILSLGELAEKFLRRERRQTHRENGPIVPV